MTISVIIPTFNRLELLCRALESLFGQCLPSVEFEVLVIDNGSTDHTAAMVEGFAQKLSNLRYFHESEPGLHAGRHRGMLEAKGEILVFADDDIEATSGWLAAIKEAFTDPEVVMVGGNNLPKFLEPPPRWLELLWLQSNFTGGRGLPPLSILELPGGIQPFNPFNVWGCNFSIRKQALLAAGGFHPDSMPPELIRFRGDGETHVSKWVAETGGKCLFHPGATVYHKVTPERMTFAYFRRRGFSQGISNSYTALRSQESVKVIDQPGLFRRAVRRIWHLIRERLPMDNDMWRAQRELATGLQEGYAFHQQAYQNDPEVRSWVHQDRYYK